VVVKSIGALHLVLVVGGSYASPPGGRAERRASGCARASAESLCQTNRPRELEIVCRIE